LKFFSLVFKNLNKIYSVNAEDANAILSLVNTLQISQIRPLSLQTVLKFVCLIYQEKKKNGPSAQAPLHVYCYDFFISQYGLKKIAEDKLKKVIENKGFSKKIMDFLIDFVFLFILSREKQ